MIITSSDLEAHAWWLTTDGARGRRLNREGAELNEVPSHMTIAEARLPRLRGHEITGDASWADLTEANFDDAFLKKASFRGASLASASLRRAIAIRADFTEADLRDADLSMADISEAQFAAADLRRAVLDGANLNLASFAGARLGEASFLGAHGLIHVDVSSRERGSEAAWVDVGVNGDPEILRGSDIVAWLNANGASVDRHEGGTR
jgi:uncharacterized protein YjbI with pentapeptide repeats